MRRFYAVRIIIDSIKIISTLFFLLGNGGRWQLYRY